MVGSRSSFCSKPQNNSYFSKKKKNPSKKIPSIIKQGKAHRHSELPEKVLVLRNTRHPASLGAASEHKALSYYKPVGSLSWKIETLALYKICAALVQQFHLSNRLCGNGLCCTCLMEKLRLPGHVFMLQ